MLGIEEGIEGRRRSSKEGERGKDVGSQRSGFVRVMKG